MGVQSLACIVVAGCIFNSSAASAPNDRFDARQVLTEDTLSLSTFLSGSTVESGEPSHAGKNITRSVWWSWTPTYTGWANFSATGSDGPRILAIYTGDTLDALSCVGAASANDWFLGNLRVPGGSLNVPVEKGVTYHIAVADASISPDSNSGRVMLDINKPPVIRTPSLVRATVGRSFWLHNQATHAPREFGSTNLPNALMLNRYTGAIDGIPRSAGVFDTVLSAKNPGGSSEATVRFVVDPADAETRPPEFSYRNAMITGTVGVALNDYISLTGNLTEFSADGLPPGLAISTQYSPKSTTQRIEGTPSKPGAYKVTFRAANAQGAKEAITTFVIRDKPAPPILQSAGSAYGTVGQSFSYSLSVDDSSGVTYTSGALPDGLVRDGGTISGVPLTAGTFEIPVTASNEGGTTSATLTVAIAPNATPVPSRPPKILGPSGITGTTGDFFSHTVDAGDPSSVFSATGLPPGTTINPATGAITGRPTKTGTFKATITATNALGADSVKIVISIRDGLPLCLTSPALAQGTAGKSFSYSLDAGFQSYLFQIPTYLTYFFPPPAFSAENLPPGLSFRIVSDNYSYPSSQNWNRGLISGTPTQPGTYRVPVSVTWNGRTTRGTLTIVIRDTDPAVARPPLLSNYAAAKGNVGSTFQYYLSGASTDQFKVTGLPPGLSYSGGTDRYIRGTPTQTGTFVVDITASNTAGSTSAKVTMLIEPPRVGSFYKIATYTGHMGQTFSESIGYSGPSAQFSATGLPPGLQINTSTGQITGTPSATGVFETTVTAASPGFPTIRTCPTIVVRAVPAPVVTSRLVQQATVGESFFYSVSASNSPTSYAITGSLPPGLTVNGASISGIPTTTGTWQLSLSATNSTATANGFLTLHVVPQAPPRPTSGAAARTYVGKSFSYSFYASGSVTTWQISGRLPAGIQMQNNRISGTPTETGTFPLQVTARGPGGSATVPFTLVVAAAVPPPTILNRTIIYHAPGGSTTISATNSPTSTGTTSLPAGLSKLSASNTITGSIANPGTHSAWLTASNASGSRHAIVRFTTDARLATGFGAAMVVASVNGTMDYFFYKGTEEYMQNRVYSAENLPAGLTIDPATSAITGSVNAEPGIHYVTIVARHASHPEVRGTLTLIVEENAEPPLSTSDGILAGSIGNSFSAYLSSSPPADSHTVEPLPPGISYDPALQRLSGTPSAPGEYPVKITSISAAGSTTVDARISIATATGLPLPIGDAGVEATEGRSFSYWLGASNAPITWTATGLPPGLAISDGSIKGVPTATGRFVVDLQATNPGGTTSAKLTIDVRPLDPPVLSVYSTAAGEVGKSFSRSLGGSNEPTAYTATDLPAGLLLNPTSGVISGIPTSSGEKTVRVTASNAAGTGSARVVFTIAPPQAKILTSSAAATGLVGDRFSLSLYSDDSMGTFHVGKLPPGLTFTGSSITGIPTEGGQFSVPVRIVNGPVETSASLSISISSDPIAPPVIDTWLTTGGRAETLLRHDLTVTNAPHSVTVTGLPPGFAFDRELGAISGYPGMPMTAAVEVKAVNAVGETSVIVTLDAFGESAILSSGTSASATSGEPFSYPVSQAISVTSLSSLIYDRYGYDPSGRNAPPVTVSVRGLPPGLFYNQAAQKIEGTPAETGDFDVTFITRQAGQERSSTMKLHVSETSASSPTNLRIASSARLTSFGAVGSPFAVEIWPTGFASEIETSALPPGLTLRTIPAVTNGILTTFAKLEGVPEKAGIFPVKVTFSDADRTASTIVTIVIPEPPLPPIMSGSSLATGTVGSAFYHSLFQDTWPRQNAATSIEIDGFPDGITFDRENNRLSGVPVAAGIHVVPIRFRNAGGTSEVFITLEFEEATSPRLTTDVEGVESEIPAATVAWKGRQFSFIIRSHSALSDLAVNGLPAGFGYEILRNDNGITGVRVFGSSEDVGPFLANIVATDGEKSVEIPLTIDVRAIDQWADAPKPTPTPLPPPVKDKPIALHLRTPVEVETPRKSFPIHGRLSRYEPSAGILHVKVKPPGGGWTEVPLRRNGRFRVRVRNLIEGKTVVLLRLKQDRKQSIRRISILRPHTR